jgi:hypothetical protein
VRQVRHGRIVGGQSRFEARREIRRDAGDEETSGCDLRDGQIGVGNRRSERRDA